MIKSGPEKYCFNAGVSGLLFMWRSFWENIALPVRENFSEKMKFSDFQGGLTEGKELYCLNKRLMRR